jgi:hypothetical protein
MKRLLAVVVAAAVAACGSSGAETTRTGSQVPNIAAMPLPLKYLNCIHDAATISDSESYVGGTCRFYLADGAKHLSVYYQSFVTQGLHDRAKPLREMAIARAAPEREASRKASAAKAQADVRQSVEKWGQCASAVIVENDKGELPILDLVKLAKVACGSLWQGSPGADEPLYYRMVQTFRTQSPIPPSASDHPSAPIIGPAQPLPPVDKRV